MGFARLCTLSGTMLFSTLVIGHLPLTLSSAISQKRIKQISIYGVGLLVGASLAIIIPEGVDAVYESHGGISSHSSSEPSSSAHSHEEKGGLVGIALVSGFLLMYLIDQLHSNHASSGPPSRSLRRRDTSSSDRPLLSRVSSYSVTRTTPKQHSKLLKSDIESLGFDHDTQDSQPEDYFPPSSAASQTSILSHISTPRSSGEHRGRNGSMSSKHTKKTWSTTVGLMAHSVADGISLGASSAMVVRNQPEVSTLDFVIFLAIMVHKAPAAFGMVAVLMSQGMPKHKIRQVLLAFSAAAPLGAIFTWGLLQLAIGSANGSDQAHQQLIEWWTGMTLLFSGGTFLFVATHVLQETAESGDHHSPTSHHGGDHGGGELLNGHLPESPGSTSRRRGGGSSGGVDDDGSSEVGKWTKTGLMTLGMISPLALTRVVGHGH